MQDALLKPTAKPFLNAWSLYGLHFCHLAVYEESCLQHPPLSGG